MDEATAVGASTGAEVDGPPDARPGRSAGSLFPEWRRGLPLLLSGAVFLGLALWLLAARAPLFAMRITLWPNLLLLGLIGVVGGIASSALPWEAEVDGSPASAPGSVAVPREQWEELVRAYRRSPLTDGAATPEALVTPSAPPEPRAGSPSARAPPPPVPEAPAAAPPVERPPVPTGGPTGRLPSRAVRELSRSELEREVDRIIGEVRRAGPSGPAGSMATVSAGAFRCRACFTRFPAGAEQTPCARCRRPLCAACLSKSEAAGHPGLCPPCARAGGGSGLVEPPSAPPSTNL